MLLSQVFTLSRKQAIDGAEQTIRGQLFHISRAFAFYSFFTLILIFNSRAIEFFF
jgi:hypothetical protein